jgi:hypothetical protein
VQTVCGDRIDAQRATFAIAPQHSRVELAFLHPVCLRELPGGVAGERQVRERRVRGEQLDLEAQHRVQVVRRHHTDAEKMRGDRALGDGHVELRAHAQVDALGGLPEHRGAQRLGRTLPVREGDPGDDRDRRQQQRDDGDDEEAAKAHAT